MTTMWLKELWGANLSCPVLLVGCKNDMPNNVDKELKAALKANAAF